MPQLVPYASSASLAAQGASDTIATSQALHQQEQEGQRRQERHQLMLEQEDLRRQQDDAAVQGAMWSAENVGVTGSDQLSRDDSLMVNALRRIGPIGAGPSVVYGHSALQKHRERVRTNARSIMARMAPGEARAFARDITLEGMEEQQEIVRGRVATAFKNSIRDGEWGEDEHGINLAQQTVEMLEAGAIDPGEAVQQLLQQKQQNARELTVRDVRDSTIAEGVQMIGAMPGLTPQQRAAASMLTRTYEQNYRTMRPETYDRELRRILLGAPGRSSFSSQQAPGAAEFSRVMRDTHLEMLKQGHNPGSEAYNAAMEGTAAFFEPPQAVDAMGGPEGGQPYPRGGGGNQPPALSDEQISALAEMRELEVQPGDADYEERLSAAGLAGAPQLSQADQLRLAVALDAGPEGRARAQSVSQREQQQTQAQSGQRSFTRNATKGQAEVKKKDIDAFRAFWATVRNEPNAKSQLETYTRQRGFNLTADQALELIEKGPVDSDLFEQLQRQIVAKFGGTGSRAENTVDPAGAMDRLMGGLPAPEQDNPIAFPKSVLRPQRRR